ncbi:MAG: hypothetical protein R8M45_04285 [Ghiorsea sp.]
MKKILAVALITMGFATAAQAFETTGRGNVGVQSQYVYRGVELTNKPIVTAGAEIATKYVNFGVSGYTLQAQKQFEVDAFVETNVSVSDVNVRLGMLNIQTVGGNISNSTSNEAYAGVTYSVLPYADVDVVGYYNLLSKNVWWEASADTSFTLGVPMSAKTGVSYAQNKNAKNALENVFASASVEVYSGVNLNADYSHPLGSSKVIGGVKANDVVSFGASYTF